MNKKYSHPLHLFVFMVSLIAVGSLGAIYISQNIVRVNASSNFGGRVTKYTPVCGPLDIPTPPATPTTCSRCPLCSGLLVSGCAAVSELVFIPAPGSAFTYLCPTVGFPYSGGTPSSGSQILGNGTQVAPIQIGVGR